MCLAKVATDSFPLITHREQGTRLSVKSNLTSSDDVVNTCYVVDSELLALTLAYHGYGIRASLPN